MKWKKAKYFSLNSSWKPCICSGARSKAIKARYESGKYVFIGYDSSSKGYKLNNPNNGVIIISRDVKFNEEEAWDWGAQEEEYNTPPLYEEEEQTRENLQEIATPLS